MIQTYQSLNPLAQVSKPSWGLSGKLIIVPDAGDFYIGTVIEQLLICKGKKRNRQYWKYQDEWTSEKHLALTDTLTSREWMSLHPYPTHSNTASKSQEQTLDSVRWSNPSFPSSYVSGQPTALGTHRITSCTLLLSYLPSWPVHSTPSPSRKLLVIRERRQRNTPERHAEDCHSCKGDQTLACWLHPRSRSWEKCETSESRKKPTETAALNHPAQQEMFLGDLQRC